MKINLLLIFVVVVSFASFRVETGFVTLAAAWIFFEFRKEIIKIMSEQKDAVVGAFNELKEALTVEIEQINQKLDTVTPENYSDVVADIKQTTAKIKGIIADAPTGEETDEDEDDSDGDDEDDEDE